MFKRLSIISIVIATIAIVAGAVYFPMQTMNYEQDFGPNIIDNDLDRLLVFNPGFVIVHYGFNWTSRGKVIRGKENTIIFSNSFDGGIEQETKVTKVKNNKFKFETVIFNVLEEESKEFKKYIRLNRPGVRVLNKFKANKVFDDLAFPNKSTRRTRKEIILDRIDRALSRFYSKSRIK